MSDNYMSEDSNDSGCPSQCTQGWVGDNVCDKSSCSNCAHFWNDGEFDGGDCEDNTNNSWDWSDDNTDSGDSMDYSYNPDPWSDNYMSDDYPMSDNMSDDMSEYTTDYPMSEDSNDSDCPSHCTQAWVGDNVCEENSCSNCAHFWNDGEFDGGDCDQSPVSSVDAPCEDVTCGCPPDMVQVEITDENGCVTDCHCD